MRLAHSVHNKMRMSWSLKYGRKKLGLRKRPNFLRCAAEPGKVVEIYVRNRKILPIAIIMPHQRQIFTTYGAGTHLRCGTKVIVDANNRTNRNMYIG